MKKVYNTLQKALPFLFTQEAFQPVANATPTAAKAEVGSHAHVQFVEPRGIYSVCVVKGRSYKPVFKHLTEERAKVLARQYAMDNKVLTTYVKENA